MKRNHAVKNEMKAERFDTFEKHEEMRPCIEQEYSYEHECKHEHECNARVINQTESICPSTKVIPTPNIPVTGCNVVVKVPVVLSEFTVTMPVISNIKLEKPAMEIKRVRKNIFITQCHLIPGSVSHCPPFTGLLVITGFVRKNIEYATRECRGKGVTSGTIHHTTVEVPFSCTTTVEFLIRPVFIPNINPAEFEMFNDSMRGCDPCSEKIMGSNPCERNFAHEEFFNERVFCELISAKIFESDINTNPTLEGCMHPTEQTFCEITEKMVIKLTIKLLQKQQVRVPSIGEKVTPY